MRPELPTASVVRRKRRLPLCTTLHRPNPPGIHLSFGKTLQTTGTTSVFPVLYAEAFAKEMGKSNHGTIALIGSVAGDRGRKSNYVYGAAKGLVTRYAQGLQHRFAGGGVKVVLIMARLMPR